MGVGKLTVALAASVALLSRATQLMMEHHAQVLPPGHVSLEREERTMAARATVTFTLHENGDGLSGGRNVTRAMGDSVDSVISPLCCEIANVPPARCAPHSGARLITSEGVRVMNLSQIRDHQRVYCVPQGLHFAWPTAKTGQKHYPRNVRSPIPGKPIVLTQLSDRPRVFAVDNFVAPEEVEIILRANRDLLKPSEVGFGGWQDDTRTSSTAWDETEAGLAIVNRTFALLGMDFAGDSYDPLQVLQYTADGHHGRGQWYKPHVDWFDLDDYENADPLVNNGTNRYATMFVYMSDVEEGGGTVFPLSTSHEGFDGVSCVHPGTEETAGYIDTKEAHWCCNASSSALKTKPKQGNAVLFYSQLPNGTLDKFSLHGGCPPIKGVKLSGNVWVWNRPHPPDDAKEKDLQKYRRLIAEGKYTISFGNVDADAIDVFYDSAAPPGLLPRLGEYQKLVERDAAASVTEKQKRFQHQFRVLPGKNVVIETYPTHAFVGVRTKDKKVVFAYRVIARDDVPAEDATFDEETDALVVEIPTQSQSPP